MPFIDLHCDTIARLLACQRAGHPAHLRTGEPLHVNLEKLRRSGYLLQAFALFVNLHGTPAPAGVGGDPLYAQSMAARPEDPLEEVLTLADLYWTELAQNRDLARPVLTFQDLVEARQAGQIGCLLTVEEGGCCKGSLGVLRRMYELGVRMMPLPWNHDNELAAPQANPGGPLAAQTQRGLTETGFAFLAEMERLHMIVDVSHLSDRGFWDIVEHGTRPFAASHSNCRALCPHTRNLPDSMIRALAEKGGIAGLNYYAAFLDTDPAHPEACRSTVERIAEHAAHYKQVGGIGVLALGSDFDGIDGHHQLETAADMPLLADALRRTGFTEDEVERIFWRNARDFFEHNL